MATFGRNRQSIVDIQQQLEDIFANHPHVKLNDKGEPVIPADSLVQVFDAFEEHFQGVRLLDPDEQEMFQDLLSKNPGLECTPTILIQFIAQKTRHTPPQSPDAASDHATGRSNSDLDENSSGWSGDDNGTRSRRSSVGPPQTPLSARSPFDAERRQRTTPLMNNAPSSWATSKRPAPARRRKSDAGSRSDSESFSASPSAYSHGRTPSRSRAPSNPTSPLMSPDTSFSSFGSRPPSRSHFNSIGGSFNDDEDDTISPNTSLYDYRGNRTESSFLMQSSVPMPRDENDDSDEQDEQDVAMGLVLDRDRTSSDAPMEPYARVDMLDKANKELSRKLDEAERTLQNKLLEHESELEEMQGRLEEMRSELNATKREEKELRSKERQNLAQIASLEVDIAKTTKTLDHARSTYTSLQRQYQEQCAASERYRDELRQREETIRSLRDASSLQEVESLKLLKEHESYDTRIAQLEKELEIAQQAHGQLDEQKQENLMLKETIDRMRFDMDDLRVNLANQNGGGAGNGGGRGSRDGTLSKSLGAELARKMKGGWGMEDDDDEDAGNKVEEESKEESNDDDEEGGDTEGEDVIQTIITRTKRKVASRANKLGIETRTFEETKEYSDSSCQYDPHYFSTSHQTQTDPEPKVVRVSYSVQTEPLQLITFATQTEPEPEPEVEVIVPRVMVEMEVQTDEPEDDEEDGRTSPSPPAEQIESLASSSSTILPPTPRARPQTLEPHDEPPAYNQINPEEERMQAVKRYHPGTKVPFEPVVGGISPEAIEEWKALKEELGIDCLVIDEIIERSQRKSRDSTIVKRRSSSRFYNIYNTYVYGSDKSPGATTSVATHALLWVGATACLLFAATPYLVPQYNVPGGPTYYDRAAWSSFNSMQPAGEGFSPEGTAAVWNFLGRVGGGAARIARGWPT